MLESVSFVHFVRNYYILKVLSKYEGEIQPEILNMLKDEIKDALNTKISDLLKALFNNNVDEWLRLLMIENPVPEQIEYFEEIRLLIGMDRFNEIILCIL